MSKVRYFQKELVSNPFFFKNAPVPFEANSSNQGVIRLEEGRDDELIAVLKSAIEKRRGGIIEVGEEEYNAIKKNENGKTYAPLSQPERLRVLPSLGHKKPAVAVATENQVQSASPVQPAANTLAEISPFRPPAGQPTKKATVT